MSKKDKSMSPMLLTVFERGKAGMPFKDLRKIGKVRIADLQGDQAHGDIRPLQHRFRLFDLFADDKFVQGNSRFLLEQAGKVLGVQVDRFSDLAAGDVPVEVLADILDRARDRA